jgi:hypothetical protein
MYNAARQTGSSGQAFASPSTQAAQPSPFKQAGDIFKDWTNRNWTAMMSKLDQDSKSALATANGVALFREEMNHLNSMLRQSGWYIVDVCHDQNSVPGIITTQDGQSLLWKSLTDLRYNERGKRVRWDGLRWAAVR